MRLPNYSPSPTPMDIRPDLDFGLNHEIPSAWDQLSPFHAYLANTFASKAKNKGMLDLRLTRALQGESLEEQDAVDYQQTQATKARELAMQSMNMPDEEYERLKEDLRTEMSNRPSMPGRSPLRTPSTGALAAAGIGALLNPGFASSIAATPFKEGLRQQAEDDERAGVQFEVDTKEWSDRLRFLESQMDDARADRNTRIQAAIELAKMEDAQAKWMRDIQYKEDNLALRGDIADVKNQIAQQNADTSRMRGQSYVDLNKIKGEDIVKTRPARLAKIQSEIDKIKAGVALTGSQKALIDKKVAYYDDEFALKKWDREIRAENARTARMNMESLAATRGIENPSEMRQVLNAERLVVKELLSLNQAQLKDMGADNPDKAVLEAEQAQLKAQLFDLNERINPNQAKGSGMDLGAPGFGLAPFDPMGGGVELRGQIGGPEVEVKTWKPVPGNTKKAQPKKGSNRINIVGIREKR